jgi:hypothetical protein
MVPPEVMCPQVSPVQPEIRASCCATSSSYSVVMGDASEKLSEKAKAELKGV